MFQETIEFPNVMEKESGCSFHCDCCVRQNEVHSFGDRIHNSHDGVISRGLREFNHEINTECVLLSVWNKERLELANRRVSLRFHLEAEIIGTHILANVPRHLGLPVIPGHQF